MNKKRANLSWKRIALQSFSVVGLSALACVTVNVNFPESAVQKATDDYVKELYKAKEKGKSDSETPPTTSTSSFRFELISSAIAADEMPKFNVNSDKARAIGASLQTRVDEVKKYKAQGALGEGADGLLVLKNPPKGSAIETKKLENLVKAENKDRTALYEEVTSSSGMSSGQVKQVARSFGNSFKKESPKGTWVEDNGNWSQK